MMVPSSAPANCQHPVSPVCQALPSTAQLVYDFDEVEESPFSIDDALDLYNLQFFKARGLEELARYYVGCQLRQHAGGSPACAARLPAAGTPNRTTTTPSLPAPLPLSRHTHMPACFAPSSTGVLGARLRHESDGGLGERHGEARLLSAVQCDRHWCREAGGTNQRVVHVQQAVPTC